MLWMPGYRSGRSRPATKVWNSAKFISLLAESRAALVRIASTCASSRDWIRSRVCAASVSITARTRASSVEATYQLAPADSTHATTSSVYGTHGRTAHLNQRVTSGGVAISVLMRAAELTGDDVT
jgi:hypothetical protein